MSEWGSIIQDVLRAKYSGCEYSVGETYESLNWHDTVTPKPTEEQLLIDKNEYLSRREEYEYEGLRGSSYPKIGDQLDMLWHAMDTGEIQKASTFYNSILDVKLRYPKKDSTP